MAPTSSTTGSPVGAKPKSAAATKAAMANASFGMNMPLMSSAFDTSMWLSAA